MRKKLAAALVLVLILGLSVVGMTSQNKAYAKEAQIYLEVPDSVKKENEFTVKVILNSDVNVYSIDAYLSYSTDTLEFIPNSEFVSGTDGVLELKDIYGEETRNAEYEITFKALDTGSAEVALTDVYLIDYVDLDYVEVAPSAKQFEVGINRQVAEDARLMDLIAAPGELTEEFSPDQLDYEMHVDLEVETIGISAIPMNEDSVVALEMPEKLTEGENLVVITVTALSGNVNTYTIKVIRKEWPEEESSEEEDSMTESDSEQEAEQTTEVQQTEPSTEQESTTEADEVQEPAEEETTTGSPVQEGEQVEMPQTVD